MEKKASYDLLISILCLYTDLMVFMNFRNITDDIISSGWKFL